MADSHVSLQVRIGSFILAGLGVFLALIYLLYALLRAEKL